MTTELAAPCFPPGSYSIGDSREDPREDPREDSREDSGEDSGEDSFCPCTIKDYALLARVLVFTGASPSSLDGSRTIRVCTRTIMLESLRVYWSQPLRPCGPFTTRLAPKGLVAPVNPKSLW